MHAKRVLMTGASSGIGLATCRGFLDAGYEVVNLSRRPAPISSPRLRSVAVDLADAVATREATLTLAAQFPATTLVHCAGAIREKPVDEVTLDDLTALANLHLAAALALVQANLPTMKSARFGRIVLVSSRALLGLARRTAYSATKAAMVGFARTWALELARYGITANVVAPGPIAETEMFHELIPADSANMQAVIGAVPVGRLGTPQDVTRAILFFASPESSFITGQLLFVCGGTSIGSFAY
jgi:3-oxoacyl-[acyl-carrier protein] reductase